MKYLISLLLSMLPNLLAYAQALGSSGWSASELQNDCMPAGETGLQSRTPECTVREFGKLAEFDGRETWYALYSNFPEPLAEAAKISALDFANVLVLFEAASGSDRLVPFRVSNAEGSYYRHFDAPQIFSTGIGSVLYVNGFGAGDGRGQFEYDQYLLWQEDAWVELNAFAWIPQVAARLPPGYQLDGIDKRRFDVMNLRYQGPVRRDADCHICATGGSVDIKVELQGNSFVLSDLRYSPARAEPNEAE